MSLKLSFKICIVGEPAVGKTSLIIRYIENKFQENYIPTLGVDFLTKKIIVGKSNTPVNLIIWDIGGDKIWKERLHLYVRGADGVLIIYDVTRLTTFQQSLEFWINQIEKYAGKIPFMLVGNKNDLEELRKITYDQAVSELKKKGINDLLETSAKTGDTVNEMFHKIAEKIIIQKAKLRH
ncbi:MAG: Rab family GTPase [Promethearchaeota archaeon]